MVKVRMPQTDADAFEDASLRRYIGRRYLGALIVHAVRRADAVARLDSALGPHQPRNA
jgi:hypothetical protein